MGRLDLVVFGATGFTGKYVVQEVINVTKGKGLTWGIAGRSKDRLQKLLSDLSDVNSADLKSTRIIIADVGDEESLTSMASQSKVILNCCGPFRFFGEPVVKACVANGTHHVDVSGEPQYMEKMQLKYHKEAMDKGVYVVSACGFDSIPADLGVIFLEKEFKGQVNSVETYLESQLVGNISKKSALIHYTTWESAVHGVAQVGELGPLRRELFPTRLPALKPKLPARSALHKSDVVNKWCLPFPGSDRSVMQRTQRYLLDAEKKRPVQIYTYVAFSSLFYALLVAFVGVMFNTLASFSFGRTLLLQYPKFFSFGTVSHEGPSEELASATHFSVTIVGRGWSEKQAEPLDNPQTAPDKTMVVRVSGVNPGYAATAITLVQSALTILQESASMPASGGVYPPGAAFARTSMCSLLTKAGLHFETLPITPALKTSASLFEVLGRWIQDMISSGIY